MGAFSIHEKFLRHIWNSRYYHARGLMTTDGQAVVVLSPGVFNEAGGPDFRDAHVQVGGTLWRGDVEIHRNVAEWIHHGHQTDPAYNRVILHVIFEGSPLQFPTITESGRTIPTIILSDFLSEPKRTLAVKIIRDEERRAQGAIPCAHVNSDIERALLGGWIRKLSRQRLELKIRRFEERLRELAQEYHSEVRDAGGRYGELPVQGDPGEIPPPHKEATHKELSKRVLWDQILYEGIMDGLGYSRNRDPFMTLARNVSLAEIKSQDCSEDPLKTEALLFGAAGLLPMPKDVGEKMSRDRLRVLRRHWRILNKSLKRERLHLADWQFFPTRPGNVPTVRIAAAVCLIRVILHGDMFRQIIRAIRAFESARETLPHLLNLLNVEQDDFWKTHYQFGVPAQRKTTPLGRSRTRDIIANSVIPIAFLYARVFRDAEIRQKTFALYEYFPPLDSNIILSRMERQLLRGKVPLKTMAAQQGVIQLFRYYCRNDRCGECEVGKAVFKT